MKALYTSLKPHLFFVLLFLCTLALIVAVAAKTQPGSLGGVINVAGEVTVK